MAPSPTNARDATRVSRVALVLTLQPTRNEGHLPCLSQSGYRPRKPTVNRRTDDPRREHTRHAAAGHSSCDADRGQRGLRGGGHLPDTVLSVAASPQPVWNRRLASAAAAGAAGSGSAAAAPGRTAPARRRDRRSDLGRTAAGGLRATAVAAAGGGQHRAASLAAARLGHSPAALARARAPQCPRRRLADTTHAAIALAAAAWEDAARRGRASRRAALSRHLLHRQAQGSRQGVAVTACDVASSYGIARIL